MVVLSLQLILVVAACFGLLRLWRAALPAERWLRWVVATGFLSRALVSQALFWISWASLPVARGLQLGQGLWFFARDGLLYYRDAGEAATKGLAAIVTLDRTQMPLRYEQALAAGLWLFGRVASVAILINLACYLGMVAIVLHWAAREPRARKAAAFAIIGISLSPAAMLWSLQPLKDTLFQFLFVAFVAASAAWQRAWVVSGRPVLRAAAGAWMLLLLLALAAIRWYFACALFVAAVLFLLLVAFRSAGRKAISLTAAAIVGILLSRALVIGAGPFLPNPIARVLSPMTAPHAIGSLPTALAGRVENARDSFESAGGETSITAPGTQLPPELPSLATSHSVLAPADEAQIRALLDRQVAAWDRNDLPAYMDTYWKSPDLKFVNGTTVTHGWPQMFDSFRRMYVRQGNRMGTLALTDLRIDGEGDAAVVYTHWVITPPAVAPNQERFATRFRRFPDGWKGVVVKVLPPAPLTTPQTVSKGVPPTLPQPETRSVLRTRAARLVSGLAVIVVPRSIGEWLGLFHIGGGRGMLWFTEIDTLFFDAVLGIALFALARRPFASLRNPLAWLVLLTGLLVGLPLVYSVTNFGTLFRLRELVYACLLVMPLAVMTGTADVSA